MTLQAGTTLSRYEILSPQVAPGWVKYSWPRTWPHRRNSEQGDTTKARKSYQDFLALWNDADADLPVLIDAKKEYEKLK